MGIQLDWQLQADQTQQTDLEDPMARRQRRQARRQMCMASLVVACVVAGVAALITWRLTQHETRAKDNLQAAAQAQLNALRLGQAEAYMSLQIGDDAPYALDVQGQPVLNTQGTPQPNPWADWRALQRQQFNDYQLLKQNRQLGTQSDILSVYIDSEEERRGRVVVQEFINGQAQQAVWFYWYSGARATSLDEALDESEDKTIGWRRVPPDAEFWGEEATLDYPHTRFTYYELDAVYAPALAQVIEATWVSFCTRLPCPESLPALTVHLDPKTGLPYIWEPEGGWRLRLLSPLMLGRVPADGSLPADWTNSVRRILAERALNHLSGGRLFYPTEAEAMDYDTAWVKAELRDWLAEGDSPFIESLSQVFGAGAVMALVQTWTPNAQINTLAPALSPSLVSLAMLDPAVLGQIAWGDFFAWRLALEKTRLQANAIEAYFSLYENGAFNAAADARAYGPAYRNAAPLSVTSVAFSFRADGALAALVSTQDATGAAGGQTTFVWVGDTFLRAD